MGKVVEKVKVANVFAPDKSMEIEAVIDTGATMIVLPQDIVDNLGLKKIREVKVRYANNKTQLKSVYGIVAIELKGRTGNFDVLAEEEGSQPLIGQVVLEVLDLVVDPRARKLIPNPRSPEMPMIEVFMATSSTSGYIATLCYTKIRQNRVSYIRETLDALYWLTKRENKE